MTNPTVEHDDTPITVAEQDETLDKLARKIAERESRPDDSIYLRLFAKAYGFTYETERNELPGDERLGLDVPQPPTMKRVVLDHDIRAAYDLLLRMRGALTHCRNVFDYYANELELKRKDHASLVESQQLENSIERNRGIANELSLLIKENVDTSPGDWMPIATAALDHRPVRLLGKMHDGTPYVETGRWENIMWSVQNLKGHLAPTHWMPLERVPDGF